MPSREFLNPEDGHSTPALCQEFWNLRKDEYGRAVETPAIAREIERAERGEKLAALLQGELQRAGVAFGVPLVTEKGALPYGVEWRSVRIEGQPIVNMFNFTRKPITVRLPNGEWQDLVAQQPLPGEITLNPNTPVLAQGATRASSLR